ncbi:phosphatidylglycerol lysyltransferase domain-containing protein [Streptomyces sp. NBC_00310]|uniref:phosphatidylglycerol lysyltransferase domain-containing protein n=1 Tax=Streptomyces sp. NBC_00310 TaxID=2903645 RepID=UPI0032448E37
MPSRWRARRGCRGCPPPRLRAVPVARRPGCAPSRLPAAPVARPPRRAPSRWTGIERRITQRTGDRGPEESARVHRARVQQGPRARLRVLLSLAPRPRGLSPGLVRRDGDADDGPMEFLVIELLPRSGEIGITQVSLNFAVFRSVFSTGPRGGVPEDAGDRRSGRIAGTWNRAGRDRTDEGIRMRAYG